MQILPVRIELTLTVTNQPEFTNISWLTALVLIAIFSK